MDNFRVNESTFVKKISVSIFFVIGVLSLGFGAFAQTPSPSPTTPAIMGVIGEVKAIDAGAKQMIVRLDSGVIFTVNLSDKTQYKRVPPGEKTLANATPITVADVGAGDRVFARGKVAADQKTVHALQVIVMSKADLAKKQERERAEWRRRGVSGIVSSLNPAAQGIAGSSYLPFGNNQ